MAVYELVQYGCDNYGTLTEVMDADHKIPEGWVFGENHRICYCPDCAQKLAMKCHVCNSIGLYSYLKS